MCKIDPNDDLDGLMLSVCRFLCLMTFLYIYSSIRLSVCAYVFFTIHGLPQVQLKPTFLVMPDHVQVKQKQTVELQCQASGDPKPSIQVDICLTTYIRVYQRKL